MKKKIESSEVITESGTISSEGITTVTNVIEDEMTDETQSDEVSETLSDEEMRLMTINHLKNANNNFSPIRHSGNITTNQFGSDYRKKRQRRKKTAKLSRKKNK